MKKMVRIMEKELEEEKKGVFDHSKNKKKASQSEKN